MQDILQTIKAKFATSGAFSFYQLYDAEWLPSIMEGLADAQKSNPKNLVARSVEYIQDLLAEKRGIVMGALGPKGVLNGFCTLVSNKNLAHALKDHALTYGDQDSRLNDLCGDAKVGVIQSLCVMPHALGKKLSLGIIGSAVECFARRVFDTSWHLFAQVALTNECSWMKFMQSGFVMEKTWEEQTTDGPRKKVLMHFTTKQAHKMIQGELAKEGNKIDVFKKTAEDLASPREYFAKIEGLLTAGNSLMLLPPEAGEKLPRFAVLPHVNAEVSTAKPVSKPRKTRKHLLAATA